MDETQTLAAQALRELLDNPDRADWDELLAANRALIKAIAAAAEIAKAVWRTCESGKVECARHADR
jgi:hypothetical protein